jgi:hypothetical protein
MFSEYGARIERGVVDEATEGKYIIASLTRPGVTTPPIPALIGGTFSVGEKVYFFLFEDGHGGIFAALDA